MFHLQSYFAEISLNAFFSQVPGVLLDWSYTPRQIRNHAADIIRRWQALDDAIASTPASSATFENTFGAVMNLHRQRAVWHKSSEGRKQSIAYQNDKNSLKLDVFEIFILPCLIDYLLFGVQFIALGLELDPLENAITFPKHVSTEPEVRLRCAPNTQRRFYLAL
jgi:hypothetical protein